MGEVEAAPVAPTAENMPVYESHKKVRGLKIAEIKPGANGFQALIFEDKRYAPVEVSDQWIQEKHAVAPGYFVLYDDGYTSWSPVQAFEEGNTLWAVGYTA